MEVLQKNERGLNVIEKKIKQWFLAQDFKTKLACVALSNLSVADNNQEYLTDEIEDLYHKEIMQALNNPSEELSEEDLMILGITYKVLSIRI